MYLLSYVLYVFSGKLLIHLPTYSFYNVSNLLADEFKNKKVIKIISIERTNEVYIFTQEKDFYIVSLRDMKLQYHNTLHIDGNIENIYCNELECSIATDNALVKMHIKESWNKRYITISSLKQNEQKIDFNKLYFCKYYSKHYQKNEGYIIKFYEKNYNGKCKERVTFLNLYDIKDLAVDDELFYSIYNYEKNAIFSDSNGKLKKAKTKKAFTPLETVHKITKFIVFLPILPFLGHQ